MDYAREKGGKTQKFNSQPQVLVQTANGFRAQTITSKDAVDELLEESKILFTRTNAEKPTSSFNTRMEMKSHSGKHLSKLEALIMMSIYSNNWNHSEATMTKCWTMLKVFWTNCLRINSCIKTVTEMIYKSCSDYTQTFDKSVKSIMCQTSTLFAENPDSVGTENDFSV